MVWPLHLTCSLGNRVITYYNNKEQPWAYKGIQSIK